MELARLVQARPQLARVLEQLDGGNVSPYDGAPSILELYESLPMFGIVGGAANPITFAADRAIAATGGESLLRVLDGTVVIADEASPGVLAGITVGGRDDALAMAAALDSFAADSAAATPDELLKRMHEASDHTAGMSAYSDGSWITLKSSTAEPLGAWIADPRSFDATSAAVISNTLRHEAAGHTERYLPGLQLPYRPTAEGVAELLARWTGQNARFHELTGLGGVDAATEAAMLRMSTTQEYDLYQTVMARAARLAGLDPGRASDYPAAVQLLRHGTPEERVRNIGDAVAHHTGSRELGDGVTTVLGGELPDTPAVRAATEHLFVQEV